MLGVLFPIACPGCGTPVDPVCPRCAAGLRRPAVAAAPPGLDGWAAPFAYEGVARELVARVKYRNVRAVVPWLAARMCEAADDEGLLDALVVAWAPTTPARRRARGFDPAELLARAVSRRTRLPCRALLVRRPGPPQTGLGAAARRAGPRMEPTRRASALVLAAGGRVLLVDDVATTGATLASAAHALRLAGARRVVALTAARTPIPILRPGARTRA